MEITNGEITSGTQNPDVMEDQHNMNFVFLITVVATIGGFLFGFDSGVINGTVDGLSSSFNSDSVATGFNVASMLLGCAAGAFAAGRLADKFGRRKILLVASVFFAVSAWGSGIAQGSGEFILYRIIGGLAVGAASIMAPAYISEVAPARYRGSLATIQQVSILAGIFLSFLSNYLIAGSAGSSLEIFAMGHEAWRWMFWVELIPAVTFFFALLFIPESPRFLVASGNRKEGIRVLTKLMGDSAEKKYAQIESSLASDHHKARFSDIFGTFGFRRIVWVGIGLSIFQQLSGINVIFYYGSVLWQSAGFSEGSALMQNVISGAVGIGACLLALAVIDKIGRKPMLLIGSIGMTVTLGIMAYIFSQANVDSAGDLILSSNVGLIAVVAANAFIAFFNFSWGPVMWVMVGEMFPNQFRGSALAMVGLAQWTSNFAITMTFPLMLTGIGLGSAYSFYTAFAFLSAFFIIKYVRETKGVELEDMEG